MKKFRMYTHFHKSFTYFKDNYAIESVIGCLLVLWILAVLDTLQQMFILFFLGWIYYKSPVFFEPSLSIPGNQASRSGLHTFLMPSGLPHFFKITGEKSLEPSALDVNHLPSTLIKETLAYCPQPIAIIDCLSGELIYTNPAAQELLGIERSIGKILYKTIFWHPKPDNLSYLTEGTHTLEGRGISSGYFRGSVEVKFTRKKKLRHVIFFMNSTAESEPIPDQLPNIKHEIQRQNTSNLFKTLLHQIHDAVLIFDDEGAPLVFNKAAEKLIDDLIDPSEEIRPEYGAYIFQNSAKLSYKELALQCFQAETYREHVELCIKNRHYPEGIFVESFWATITDLSNRKIGVLSVFHDIHQSKIYEKDLIRKIHFEKLLTEISGYFIKEDQGIQAQGMERVLSQIRSLFEYEGILIGINTRKDQTTLRLFSNHQHKNEWISESLKPETLGQLSCFRNKLKLNSAIAIQNPDQIPKQAIREKTLLEEYKIHDLIVVPLFSGKSLKGFIALYDAVQKNYAADLVKQIRLLGEIILNAILKEEKEQEIRLLNTSLEQRVQQRTRELEEINQFLEEEMNNRLTVQKELLKKTLQLEAANREMESFSYSVSHDLRAPLRAIHGFSKALLEDYDAQLDSTAHDYLDRIIQASQKMGKLIDGLLSLSYLSRKELRQDRVNLSKIAVQIINNLKESEPERPTELFVKEEMIVYGDAKLLEIALENLINNAWKFSSQKDKTFIEFDSLTREDQEIFYIRDQGIGFDMQYAKNLFSAFYRLHSAEEFSGSGIGLATVKRIINRHGGHIWAEAIPGAGATFYFILHTSKLS